MTYAIKKIVQQDNTTFSIEWNDGKLLHYKLCDLQKKCPCAQCVDESTGERRSNETFIDPNVRAKKIKSVGRYALKIEFTKGCSAGIYSFDLLRE